MNRANVRLLFGLLRGHGWALPLILLLGVAASLAEGLTIGLLVPLLATTFGGLPGALSDNAILHALHTYAEAFDADWRVPALVTSAVALIAFKSMIVYADSALSSWVNGRITHGLRLSAAHQLLTVGFPYLHLTNHGKLLNTIDSEIGRTGEALSVLFTAMVRVCIVLVFTTLLLLISWRLTLLIAACMAAVTLLVRGFSRPARRLGAASVRASEELSERSVEILDGMRMIRAFGQEDREEARFTATSDRLRRAEFRLDLLGGIVDPVLELLYVPILLSAIIFAAAGGMDAPTLLAFLLLLYRLQPHVRALDANRIDLASLTPAIREVFALLDPSDKPLLRSGATPIPVFRREIEFRNVRFAYGAADDERPALSDVSFTIRRGAVTAIVGESGAGKSTLVNLLFRFYDPSDGEILVDGVPLTALNLAEWRQRLAIAGQDADLMAGTVRDNIAYGRPGASQAEVEEAARLADAHGFITALPAGYATRLGVRGVSLSGGQRQRIGLARAFLRRPDILVLDEATNSLDSLSESAVQTALDACRGEQTLLVIAHRLSTIANADHVVVLSRGQVAEAGSPSVLLAKGGLFAELHALQTSAFTETAPDSATEWPQLRLAAGGSLQQTPGPVAHAPAQTALDGL